jgi:hypothetical protein
LLTLVGELRGLSDANKELIESGLSVISDALRSSQPAATAGTYTQAGRASGNAYRSVTLDGAL